MTKYVYQTINNVITALFPDDLNHEDCGVLPEGYGWYLSDVPVDYNVVVGEDGKLIAPEPLQPPTALETQMTENVDWSKVVMALDRESPLISAVLQLFAAKLEGNTDIAERAMVNIITQVRKSNGTGTTTP